MKRRFCEIAELSRHSFAGYYVLLRADWTRYDPEITNELSRVGRSGVPTYVIISGANQRSTHVLPELLTCGVVLDAIRQAGIDRDS